MPEPENPPPPPARRAPDVEATDDLHGRRPRYGWFAGILEGRVGDAEALRAAGARLARAVPSELELDGGRFNFMFDERPVDGSRLGVDRQDALVDGLQRLVEASAEPDDVESTLRGALVYDDFVIETLFAPRGGRIEPVSRKRTVEPRDRQHAPDDGRGGERYGGLDAPFRGKSKKSGLLLVILLLLGGALWAFTSGYGALARDALFGAGAEEIETDTGVFGTTLELRVERTLARYEVEVARGPDYPETPERADALVDAATTNEERAAMNAVANGESIWVRVVDESGRPLGAVELELRPLLSEDGGPASARVRAHSGAAGIELALDRGRTNGKR